jgi:hypothetical protein
VAIPCFSSFEDDPYLFTYFFNKRWGISRSRTATMFLLGFGMIGLAGLRRKFRK